MRYIILLVSPILILFSSCKIIGLNNNNYNRLTNYEKPFIQYFALNRITDTVDYKRFRVKSGSIWDTLKIEQIRKLDLEKIFSQYDSTIVYFAKPWCTGYDTLAKKVFKYWKTKYYNTNVKLLIVHDSYYLGFIQKVMADENFTERVYILDKSYGSLIYKNFRIFKRHHLGIKRKYAVKYPVIFFNRQGKATTFVKGEDV